MNNIYDFDFLKKNWSLCKTERERERNTVHQHIEKNIKEKSKQNTHTDTSIWNKYVGKTKRRNNNIEIKTYIKYTSIYDIFMLTNTYRTRAEKERREKK